MQLKVPIEVKMDIDEIINRLKRDDFVQVVRCKDCKWWKPDKETCIKLYDLPYAPAYGYCSRAERKEE